MNISKFLFFLKHLNNVGDVTIRKLINNNVINSLDLNNREELIKWFKDNIKYFSNKFNLINVNNDLIDKTLNNTRNTIKYLEEIGASYITYYDDEYPDKFKKMVNTNDYPIILFYKGDISLLKSNKLCSIIGTREPSIEAVKYDLLLTKKYTKEGYVIVSGLAKGCDTVAHEICLANNGKTIAIVATGIDIVYPKENEELVDKIINNNGLVITEEMPKFRGAAYSFVARDRLQASIANIVIAIETSSRGGTMHASRGCYKYGNKLMTVDPSLLPNSDASGNRELINIYKAEAINKF